MQRVVDLARTARERKGVQLKTPLRRMIVVHPDAGFLDDLSGELLECVHAPWRLWWLVLCSVLCDHVHVHVHALP
jgi:isoleucyl-tRNA synthetase